METTLFDWWKRQGKTLAELAEELAYSRDYIYHLAMGDYPITQAFKMRCLLYLGESVDFLFFDAETSVRS